MFYMFNLIKEKHLILLNTKYNMVIRKYNLPLSRKRSLCRYKSEFLLSEKFLSLFDVGLGTKKRKISLSLS